MIKQQLESMRASIADTPYDIQHRARMDDTTLVHRDGRHGLFIRSDGTTDVMSATSYIGVGTNGISAQAPAIYLQTRGMAIKAEAVAIEVPEDGLFLHGRRVSSRILNGLRLCAQHHDVKVLVSPNSPRTSMKTDGDSPPGGLHGDDQVVVHEGMMLTGVPLSSLFDHEPFSLKAEYGWLRKQIETLQKAMEELP